MDMEEDSRKRPAYVDVAGTPKRPCQDSTASRAVESPQSNDTSSHPPLVPNLLSIKDLLSVPLEYVFRKCQPSGYTQASQTQPDSAQHRLKPLLSRNEASCFLRIQCLAMEVDALIQLSTQALMEQVEWMAFHDELIKADVLPLRALLPILLTLGQTFVQVRLQRLNRDLSEVLNELELLAENLRQSREANWDTADALMDAGVNNATLQEKRHLGDIQDELAQRIDSVLKSTMVVGTKTDQSYEEASRQSDILSAESPPKSMADFCHELLKETPHSVGKVAQSQSPLRQSSSQNSRMSLEPTGKENAPSSQHSLSSHSAAGEESGAYPGAATQHAALALSTLAFSSSSRPT